MTDSQFFSRGPEGSLDRGHFLGPQPGTTPMTTQVGAESGAAFEPYEAGEPVVAVPEDAIEVTEDVTVEDDIVAYTPDGTVIDTREAGTTITTSDGVRVRITPEGALEVDTDFSNEEYVPDVSTLGEGAELTAESGTKVARNDEGSVVVTQPNGQVLTLHDDGSVDVDLPDGDGSGLGDGLGDGSGVLPSGEEEGAEGDEEGAEDELADGEEDVEDAEEALDEALEEPEEPAPPATPVPPGGGTTGGGGTGGGGTGGGGNTGGGGTGGGGDDGGGGEDPAVKDPESEDTGENENQDEEEGKDCPPEQRTPPGECGDYEVDTGDLRADARLFEGIAPAAETLSSCWQSMSGLIQHWGLWADARGPFTDACNKFSQIYSTGAHEMQRNATTLNESADAYDQQEEFGTECANQICS